MYKVYPFKSLLLAAVFFTACNNDDPNSVADKPVSAEYKPYITVAFDNYYLPKTFLDVVITADFKPNRKADITIENLQLVIDDPYESMLVGSLFGTWEKLDKIVINDLPWKTDGKGFKYIEVENYIYPLTWCNYDLCFRGLCFYSKPDRVVDGELSPLNHAAIMVGHRDSRIYGDENYRGRVSISMSPDRILYSGGKMTASCDAYGALQSKPGRCAATQIENVYFVGGEPVKERHCDA